MPRGGRSRSVTARELVAAVDLAALRGQTAVRLPPTTLSAKADA
jgi:hypothetical protein